jgi:AraC family transcriptional regulator
MGLVNEKNAMKFSFGAYYGKLQKQAEVAGIGLTETVYPAHVSLPVHTHENPYFCLVLQGDYAESYGRRERLCHPAMLVFHPAGEAHANRFGKAGGACFNLEFGAAWADRLRSVSASLNAPSAYTDPAIAGLAMRLRREFHCADNVSALAIESLALEIIVTTARRTLRETASSSPPRWLQQAEELIRSRFVEPLTLSEIATAINRHPVHVARQFRLHHGCTIGDYIRRLRLETACRQLTTTDESLATVALSCGFAGQSHFSTVFKRALGFSPRRYRKVFGAR